MTARSQAGFSLLEAVITSALLLLTVTTVTLCMSAVSGSARRDDSAQRAERALCSASEWLASLPYCADELPAPGAGRGPAATDLVAAVFPHACSWDDDPRARYVVADEENAMAGSFVTSFVLDGVEVVSVASFLGADGLRLPCALVDGFHLASSESVPGSSLRIELLASTRTGTRRNILVRTAGAVAGLESPQVAG